MYMTYIAKYMTEVCPKSDILHFEKGLNVNEFDFERKINVLTAQPHHVGIARHFYDY